MGRFMVTRWSDLSPQARRGWLGLRGRSGAHLSPFYDPAYLDALAAVRPDLEVLFAEEGGRLVAALPFQRDGFGGLIPAGGPLSDWNGFLAAPGAQIDVEAALEAAGAHALRVTAAPPDDPTLPASGWRDDLSHLIDLSEGPEAWLAGRSRAQPKAFRSLRARRRKALERFGTIAVHPDDRSPEALAQLFAWKRAQYRRTRQFDVFGPGWTRALVERLFRTRTEGFSGRLSTLWFGDRLAAVHFGMQSGGRLHWWFPVYDPELAAYSPGLLLLQEVIAEAPALGVVSIDLGPGDYRFKHDFANTALPLAAATACRSSTLGRARIIAQSMTRRLPQLAGRAVARAYRTWTFAFAPGSHASAFAVICGSTPLV